MCERGHMFVSARWLTAAAICLWWLRRLVDEVRRLGPQDKHTLKYFPFHGFNISQAFYRKLLILPLISLSSPSASASSFLHLCDHFKLLCELFLSQRRTCSMKHLFKPTCPVNVNLQSATTQFPCRANRIYQLLQRSLADECLWWTNGPETAVQGIKVTACMSSSEEPQRETKKQKREIFKHLQKHRNDR